jgi:hypothetical protein
MTARIVDILTARGPAGRLAQTGTVTAVNADATVDLLVAGATVPGTPRLETYTTPVVGDVVLIIPTARGWVAAGRFATP